MRTAALGLHHEDTHRSAMDVYTRRRNHVLIHSHDYEGYLGMAQALDICFEMVEHAAREGGGECCAPPPRARTHARIFSSALFFCARLCGACRRVRPPPYRADALSKSLQGMGSLIFLDLYVLAKKFLWCKPRTIALLEAAANTLERLPADPLPTPPNPMPAPDAHMTAEEWLLRETQLRDERRKDLVKRLRELHEKCSQAESWPAQHYGQIGADDEEDAG